ncbi:MAG TPA: endonuclease/exonuclease/phosphatase family protein [Novosphingobium sp.]|nr:endonuclease/exonuclease/phosphatase family protein [Novosphingobium sp.]
MRIVTWNCNGAFRRKLERVDALQADVLVIQECEDPLIHGGSYRDWAGSYAWLGENKHKGIGVFARNNRNLELLDWTSKGHELFLPTRVDGLIDVVGVWTQESKSRERSYVRQFWHYLQLHEKSLGEDSIICGDFNSNAIWDRPNLPGNHTDCINLLKERGFVSLYHMIKGERHGEEETPTFYLYRHEERPYHIDYVFAHNEKIQKSHVGFEVGQPQDWLPFSDHMPIIVDI